MSADGSIRVSAIATTLHGSSPLRRRPTDARGHGGGLLDVPRDQVIRLAQEASKRGWLDFKGAGNVFEVNFRQLLTPMEIKASHGPN